MDISTLKKYFLTCIDFFLQDECSFVSLRDVERAMLVFEYFYDKMYLFGHLMDSVNAEVTQPMHMSCTQTIMFKYSLGLVSYRGENCNAVIDISSECVLSCSTTGEDRV